MYLEMDGSVLRSLDRLNGDAFVLWLQAVTQDRCDFESFSNPLIASSIAIFHSV